MNNYYLIRFCLKINTFLLGGCECFFLNLQFSCVVLKHINIIK